MIKRIYTKLEENEKDWKVGDRVIYFKPKDKRPSECECKRDIDDLSVEIELIGRNTLETRLRCRVCNITYVSRDKLL